MSIHDQSRADVCQNLFGTNQVALFQAFHSDNASRPFTVYNSREAADTEHANFTDTSELAAKYLEANPGVIDEMRKAAEDEDVDDYSVLPYQRDKDSFAELMARLRNEMADDYEDLDLAGVGGGDDDGGSKAYVEGEDTPIIVPKATPPSKPRVMTGEYVQPDIVYAQPHNVRKNPAELAPGQVDNFENPYGRRDYPGRQNPAPQYPSNSGYGRRRRRRKRGAALDGEPKHKYWAIHRLLATGII